MGLRIDSQNAVIAARRETIVSPSPSRLVTTGKPEPSPPPLPKAGFGAGTASQATAAYVTLGRGLHAARQIVPTTEEIQADLRAKLSEVREQREKLEQNREARRAEFRIPAPSPHVNAFISQDARSTQEADRTKPAPESAADDVQKSKVSATPAPEPTEQRLRSGGRLNVTG